MGNSSRKLQAPGGKQGLVKKLLLPGKHELLFAGEKPAYRIRLMEAVKEGDLQLLEKLLSEGKEGVNSSDEVGPACRAPPRRDSSKLGCTSPHMCPPSNRTLSAPPPTPHFTDRLTVPHCPHRGCTLMHEHSPKP